MASSLQDWLNDERKKRQQAAQAEQRARSSNPGNSDMATQPVRQPTKAPTPPKFSNPGNSDMATQPSVPKWKSTAAPTVDRQKNTGGNPGIGEAPPSWRSSGPPAITQRVKDELTVGAQVPNWRSAQPPTGSNPLGYGSTSSPTINKPNGPPMPQDTGPILPSWRSAGQPMGGRTKDDTATFGPPKPATDVGPMMPSWRSTGGPPVLNGFGDREPLYDTSSSGLQIGMSTPRANTGPTQIGSLSAQPKPDTVQAPETSPWRVNRGDITGGNPLGYGTLQKQDPVTGGNPLSYGGPPTGNIDPTTNASVWRRTADVIGAGAQAGLSLLGDNAGKVANVASNVGSLASLLTGGGGDARWANPAQWNPANWTESPDKLLKATPGYEMYDQAQTQRDAATTADNAANPAGFDLGDPWRLAKQAGRAVAQGAGAVDAYIGSPIKTEKLPGLPFSAGDLLAAGVEPMYESAYGGKPKDTPTATAATDWASQHLPAPVANLISPILHTYGVNHDVAMQSLQESIDLRKRIEALPADQQAAGRLASYRVLSGPQNMQQRLNDMLNKDQQLADLNKKAQEAQASGDALAAAQYGEQIQKLKSTSYLDMADTHQNYVAEIVGDLLLNPTNYIPLGEIGKGIKEAKQAAAYGIDAAKGVENLNAAMAASEKILKGVSDASTGSAYDLVGEGVTQGAKKVGGVVPGVINDIRPWYEKLMPRNRTGQTRALQSTGNLWQTATQLIGNVTDKADARNLIAAWVDNPQALITQGLETGAGHITPGAGSIANQYITKEMPILQLVADKLKNLPSLAGDGTYTAADVAGDLEKVFYDGARSLFGQTPMELPAGATAFKLVKDGAIGKIQYLDKSGKVIKETQDVLASAEATYKMMKGATKQAQAGGMLKGISFVDDIQKHILSDMFLSRPSYMIKNAASAMAGLIPDGNYSTKTTPEITSWWSKKLGEFGPNLRTQAEMYGENAALQNWTRKFWPTNNPYAATIEKLQNLPRTLTKLLGGGVPLAEDKLYLNAADAAGQRAFRGHWQNTLQNTFAPALKELGIGDDVIQHLTQSMMAAGVDGSRQDVLAAAQALASGKTLPFTLEHLGVPSETLSLDAWAKINQIFTEGVPEQADEAARMIGSIFHDETGRYAKTLLDDAPMPVQYEWTNSALQHDSAEIMDTITQAAKRAGGDPAQAAEQAKGVSQQFTQAVSQGWETFRNDLAQAQNSNPDVAIDVYQQYNDILRQTREAADKLARRAINVKDPAEKAAAWAEHQTGVAQLWQDASQKLNEVFTNGRAALLQGGEYKPQNSWTDIVKRFIQYDDAAIAEARAAGGGMKAAGSAGYEQVIDAGRKYIDKSTYELFEAYRRAPSMENYDLMVDAMRKYETYGQQVRQYLQPLREAALTAKNQEAAWAKYYATRNATWMQMFDNAAMYNNVNKRIMVANGVGERVASNLQWTDDFAGGAFKLIGPDGQGGWKALNEAGEAVKFSDPEAFKAGKSALPPIPENIVNDFNKAIGNSENIVDEVVQDIAKATGDIKPTNPLQAYRAKNPYTVNPANPLNLHGGEPGGNLYEQVAKDTAESLKNGGVGTLPYSHLNTYQIEQLRKAEQTILAKLPEILGGKPNTLTPGQSVALMDKIKDLIPHFDNAVTMASRAGEEAANFAMLNMADRRNIDQVLGLIMPYHYFFSRTPKNWAIRTLQHPSIARLWYDSQRAIDQENKDANLPTRMQGSIPNPLASYGVGPERISNPIDFMLPYAQYFGDNEVDDAPTVFEKYARPVMSQMYPLWQIAIDASLDKASPLPNGQKRTSAYEVGDYVPLYRAAGSVYQAMTGQQLGSGWTAAGDQWDAYRNARQVATMGEQGDIAKITGSNDAQQNAIVGKYAEQIAVNIQNGKPANTDVPPEMFDTANKVYTEASKAVGYDQARSQIMNWVLGIRGHDVQPGEQAMRQASAAYGGLGYGPDNPYGSKEAKREFIDQNPMLSTWWGKNATVPGATGPTPAGSAQNDQKNAERNKLYADMNKAAEAYLQSHPEADKQELNAIKAPFYDQINALDAKYPNAAAPEGSGDPTKGMNPAERAQWELEGILKKTAEGKPEYPVNGTPQQIKDYYLALNKFTPEQRASVERSLNGLLAMDETEYPGISQWKGELKKLVGNQYASEIIRANAVRRASATEQDWSSRMAVVQELKDTERQAAQGRIVKEIGQTAYDNMQAYYALPKGGEERKQFAKEHPEVERAIMLAYNPTQYEQAKKIFGDNVWNIYYDPKRPAYPGDNASDADKKAYYAKLDAYNKANPRSEEIRLWVNGRSRPEGGSASSPSGPVSLSGVDSHQQIATTPTYNDFGADWAEARRIFGKDIFKTVANFPQTDDKKVIGKYLAAHPELTGYWQWKKDLQEHPERAPQRGVTWDVPSQTLRDAVAGQPRPLGSNAQPIGSTSSPTVAPDMQANNHGIGYGAQTPPLASSGAAVPAELPSTTAASTSPATVPPMAPDGTPMDMLDYARQDPKFVKREAMNAEFAKRDEALTKQFGADSVSLYSQYHDLPKDSDARKKFLAEHPEVRQMDAWLYGRSAGRDKDSKAAPSNYGADYEEAKRRFGDHIWDLYGQYDKDWSKAQKKAFFNEHPEYSNFLDFWYGDDGKGGGTYHRKVPGGHVRHGQNRGKGKRRGGYWLGQWWIDENGVPHLGGPDGPVGPGPSMGDSGGDAPQMIGAPENNGPTQSAPQMIGTPENNGPGDVPATLQELQMRASPGESLDSVIALYREAAKEDPQNDWLTHLPPEVAAEELQKAINSKRVTKRPQPSGETKTLAELIALYREAAKEDPQNDWLTHLPPEVAQQELALAMGGGSSYRGSNNYHRYQPHQRTAYVDPRAMLSDLRVGENDIRPWRPDWTSRGWMNAGQELRPEQLRPWRSPRNY